MTLDIYTCAHDDAPIHPDAPLYQCGFIHCNLDLYLTNTFAAKCNKIARLPTKLNLIPIDELDMNLGEDGYMWYYIPFKISIIRNLEFVRFDLVFTPSNGAPRPIAHVDAEWVSA